MNRRGFLGGIIAAASAPAIVKADSLMKIIVPKPIYHTGGIVLGSGRLWFDPVRERMEPIELMMKRVRQYDLAAEFQGHLLLQIAAGIGVSYEQLSHDLSSRPLGRSIFNGHSN